MGTSDSTNFASAAKSLGLTVKNSDAFARGGSLPDVGNARIVMAAFKMDPGQVGPPALAGEDWVVYRVAAHQLPNPDDLAKQREEISQQLLQDKQTAAFDAFHKALVDRLTKEHKLVINLDVMNRVTSAS